MDKEFESLPENVRQYISNMHKELNEKIKVAINGCDSPIEQLFALGLVSIPSHGEDSWFWSTQETMSVGDKDYRVDFLLEMYDAIFDPKMPTPTPICDWTTQLVVECDGWDYHSSKEQVDYDNKRDQDILRRYSTPTIRFSGSEIAKSPTLCARTAIKVLESLNDDMRRQAIAAAKGARINDLVRAQENES
jgi:hypothetical protein